MDPTKVVSIDYTNHRGERHLRLILPLRIVFESSEFHPVAQWILYADDLQKNEERGFALKDVHSWMVRTWLDETTVFPRGPLETDPVKLFKDEM
jgi:predicted DNA-binding transcriptional regulator YafY